MSENNGSMIAFFLPISQSVELHRITSESLGEGATKPEDMHLTLAYFGESAALTDEQQSKLKTNLANITLLTAPLQGSINGIGRFVDHDPNAIVANFDAPGLAALRAWLIAELRNCEIEPVLNHGFTPHITLGYLPESEPTPAINLSATPCLLDSITLAMGDERNVYPLTGRSALSETKRHMQEMYIFAPSYSVADEPKFPDIPIDPRVNLAALTEGDAAPVFVVRPLAILDEISTNGLPYNKRLCDDIHEQAPTKVARRGHIPKEEKNSSFPPDEGYWVGTGWDSTFYGKPAVFGKCYIAPNTPLREMVLRRRAAGTPLSNSIWGDIFEAVDEYGNSEPIGCRLESIDFVPEERAALQALGGEFVITSEMSDENKGVVEMADETTTAADNEQFKKRVAEMKPEDLTEMLSPEQRKHVAEMHLKGCAPGDLYQMLPPDHRKHVSEAYCGETGSKMVAKEAAAVQETAVAEMSTFKTSLAEMEKTVKRYEHEAYEREFSDTVDSYFSTFHVTTQKGIDGLKALKGNLKMHAIAEMAVMQGGVCKDNVKPATEKAYVAVKPLVEMFVASSTGGSAIVSGNAQGNNPALSQYGIDPATGLYTEDAVRAAVVSTNILNGREGIAKS